MALDWAIGGTKIINNRRNMMSNLKTKKTFSNSLVVKYNRSKTWVYTISILDNWTDKKIAYAGGCGYSKVGGVLTDFIYSNFEDNLYLKTLRERIDGGFLAGWNDINVNDLITLFIHLGYVAKVNQLDNGKFPVFKIELHDMIEEDFKNVKTNFINNNLELYKEIELKRNHY